MRKITLLAAVAAMTTAVPAFAQDFTGARAEVHAGWDSADIDVDDSDESFDLGSGVVYGVEVGYDAQIGQSVVLGGYAGFDLASTKECFSGDDECFKAGRNFTAGARIGVPVGKSALLYAKGGYSNGRIKLTDSGVTESDSGDGYHIGGGAQANFGKNLYGKVEYVYTRYNSDFDAHLTRNQVIAGLGVRF